MPPRIQLLAQSIGTSIARIVRGNVLFWKLLLLLLGATIASTTAIGLYLQYSLRDAYSDFIHDQLGSYVSLIVRNVGVPPDTAAAAALVKTHPIDVRIECDDWMYRSDTAVASLRTLVELAASPVYDRGDSLLIRRYDTHFYTVRHIDRWTYIIRLRSVPENVFVFSPTLILALVLVLLVFGTFMMIRNSMRPIDQLMHGVSEIGSGNFSHRVPIESKDELGMLSRAFNGMAKRVAEIIASKRRLLFDVSHELRSPLTRMNVAVAMLPETKATATIRRNVLELNSMITELLENERLAVLGGKLVVEHVDIVDLVKKVIDGFGNETGRIVLDSLTDSIFIVCDRQRLAIAVRNVVANALKYSVDAQEAVNVAVFPDEHLLHIVVVDRGIGIPDDERERVFEPFYRTDTSRTRSTGGYGLGLSLTRAIIEAHGGNIRLESEFGIGTTITMSLPEKPPENAIVRTISETA